MHVIGDVRVPHQFMEFLAQSGGLLGLFSVHLPSLSTFSFDVFVVAR